MKKKEYLVKTDVLATIISLFLVREKILLFRVYHKKYVHKINKIHRNTKCLQELRNYKRKLFLCPPQK